MSRPALLALLAASVGLFLWSRSTGQQTAVAIAEAGAPLDSLSDFADQAVADVVGWTIPSRGQQFAAAIYQAEQAYGIPHNLLARLLYQESRFRADIVDGTVKSATGAEGIAQFEPATAAGLGIDPLNPSAAIDGAGRYLSQLFNQFGTWTLALAAYNDGPGNISKISGDLSRAPEETQNYVSEITGDVPVA